VARCCITWTAYVMARCCITWTSDGVARCCITWIGYGLQTEDEFYHFRRKCYVPDLH